MRRRGFLILLAAVVALAIAGTAIAVNVGGAGRAVKHYSSDGEYVAVDSSSTGSGLPIAYTIYSYGATDIYVSRYIGDGWEDFWRLKSGSSILIPAPQTNYNASTGYYSHLMRAVCSDTVGILPWF